MSTTPTTPNPSKNEMLCSVHKDRPILSACLYPGCAQPLLCLTCFKAHPDDHENEIYELSSLRIQTQLKGLEKELVDDADSMLYYVNTQKDQIGSQNKELIIKMMEKIIKDIQEKIIQLLDNATPEEDDTTRGFFSRLESNLRTIGDFKLSEDVFENIAQIKVYNEEKLPAVKTLIREAEKIWETWKFDASKLNLCEKELGGWIENLQLTDFLPNLSLKSPMKISIPELLKESEVDVLNEEVMKLKQENARLAKELEDSGQAIEQYKSESERSQLENQVSILSEEVRVLKTENLSLSTQIIILEEEKITLEKGLDSLKEKNELEKMQMQMQNELTSLIEENQKLKSQAKTFDQLKTSFKDLLMVLLKDRRCAIITSGPISWHYCKGLKNGCTSSGIVWGSNPYTSDSDPCRAALHAGIIDAEGGIASKELGGSASSFIGSSQNGVSTKDYGYYGSTHHYSSI